MSTSFLFTEQVPVKNIKILMVGIITTIMGRDRQLTSIAYVGVLRDSSVLL